MAKATILQVAVENDNQVVARVLYEVNGKLDRIEHLFKVNNLQTADQSTIEDLIRSKINTVLATKIRAAYYDKVLEQFTVALDTTLKNVEIVAVEAAEIVTNAETGEGETWTVKPDGTKEKVV